MEKYTAKDVMIDKYVLGKEGESLRLISQRIIDADTSEAIIFDDEGNAKGIITLRDITRAVAKGYSPNESIRSIMTRNLIAVKEHTQFKEVLHIMAKHNISRVPVVNDKNEIIGIISEKHLLKIIPGVMEILEELALLSTQSMEGDDESKLYEGFCEVCSNYSDELKVVNGKFICLECLEDDMEG